MYYPHKVFSFREMIPHFTVNYEKLTKDSFKLMFVVHNYIIDNLDIKYINGILTIKTKDECYYSLSKMDSITSFPSREKFWVNIEIPYPLDGIAAIYDGLVLEIQGHIGKGPAIIVEQLPIVKAFDENWDEVIEMTTDEPYDDEEFGDYTNELEDTLLIEIDPNELEWAELVNRTDDFFETDCYDSWGEATNSVSDNTELGVGIFASDDTETVKDEVNFNKYSN